MTFTLYVHSVVSCRDRQHSMEVPFANQIVVPVAPPLEGHKANTQMPGTAVLVCFWFFKEMSLPLRNINALPPEQSGVHGPGARP